MYGYVWVCTLYIYQRYTLIKEQKTTAQCQVIQKLLVMEFGR